MKETRRKQMENLINKRQTMTMEELCEYFQVSMNTIRADVSFLTKSGAIEKVYGGVRALQSSQFPVFSLRTTMATSAKKHIAQLAEQLVCDGDSIFIDAGTTTMGLIDCLSPQKNITLLTRNLYVMSVAATMPNVELIILPGVYDRRTNSVSDVSTLEFMERYQPNKAFMGVSNISADGKLNVSSYIEYRLKSMAMKRSNETYVMVDSSKFGETALMPYGDLKDTAGVITDPDYNKGLVEFCQEQNIPVYV